MKKLKIIFLKWQIWKINKKINLSNPFSFHIFYCITITSIMLIATPYAIKPMGAVPTNDNLSYNTKEHTTEVEKTNYLQTDPLTTSKKIFFLIGFGVFIFGVLKFMNSNKNKTQLEDKLIKKTISLEQLTARKELTNLEKTVEQKQIVKKVLL